MDISLCLASPETFIFILMKINRLNTEGFKMKHWPIVRILKKKDLPSRKVEFNFICLDDWLEDGRKNFGNYFLANFLGRGWLFSRAVSQAGRHAFEMKTSEAIHPQ